jgi:recombination protein RecR
MKSIDELAELFKKLPGVGPRQARRFVYHLLTASPDEAARIAALLKTMHDETLTCTECRRFFPKERGEAALCKECRDQTRDHMLLAVVPRDSDREAIEKSGTYRGYYFVLGGTIPVLGDHPEKRVRLPALLTIIKKRATKGLKEIIFAMDANPEGDHTAEFLTERLSSIAKELSLNITTLGRGLSTGTELEYADADTIKNALKNRSRH